MLAHRSTLPTVIFNDTHLCIPGWKRGIMGVKVSCQGHNTLSPARRKPGTLHPKLNALTMIPPCLDNPYYLFISHRFSNNIDKELDFYFGNYFFEKDKSYWTRILPRSKLL